MSVLKCNNTNVISCRVWLWFAPPSTNAGTRILRLGSQRSVWLSASGRWTMIWISCPPAATLRRRFQRTALWASVTTSERVGERARIHLLSLWTRRVLSVLTSYDQQRRTAPSKQWKLEYIQCEINDVCGCVSEASRHRPQGNEVALSFRCVS